MKTRKQRRVRRSRASRSSTMSPGDFAQPLGIHLAEWEGRIIETKKGVVRLLPVRERSQQLFGDAGSELAADRIEKVSRGARSS